MVPKKSKVNDVWIETAFSFGCLCSCFTIASCNLFCGWMKMNELRKTAASYIRMGERHHRNSLTFDWMVFSPNATATAAGNNSIKNKQQQWSLSHIYWKYARQSIAPAYTQHAHCIGLARYAWAWACIISASHIIFIVDLAAAASNSIQKHIRPNNTLQRKKKKKWNHTWMCFVMCSR